MKTRLLLLFVLVAQLGFSQIFSEDFEGTGGVMPAGWTVINNDGLTPDANVSQFTDAWIVAPDFDNTTDTVVMSTSWYAPAGTSDDWLITPAMTLTTNNVLTWEEEGQDAAFPDGYEVRISTTTPTMPAFLANPALLTVAASSGAAWLTQTIDLDAAGYSNQSVYLAWRNTATDQFVLMIDDILVQEQLAVDVAMTDTTSVEYTIIPIDQVTPLGTNGVIENIGAAPVTNANMTVNVYNGLMANVYTGTSNTIPSIAAGASSAVTAAGYSPLLADLYTIELISNITEVDGNLTNDTVISQVFVSDSVYARDDAIVTGSLGIGNGAGGQLGQSFDVNATDDITSVSMFITNGNLVMNGRPLSATVFATDVNGTPTTALVSTDIITVDTTLNNLWTIPIAGGSYTLNPGKYVVVANEVDSNITLGTTVDIFTPGETWVLFGANPWANNEAYGFPNSYVLRANFGAPACTPTGSLVTDAACNSYTWAQNAATYTASGMYYDTLTSSLGCDSIITLDLTINIPTTATDVVSSCSDYTWSVDGQVYNASGLYTAVIPNSAGCDSTITLDLTIGAVDVTTSTLVHTITANLAGATYQWIDCSNGNAVLTGETAQAYTATVNGDYAVIVTEGGCIDTSACVTINTISLVENALLNNVDIYPNPSNGKFTIEVTDLPLGTLNVQVVDARGRVLLTTSKVLTNGNGNVEINIQDVEAGIYFVNLTAGDNHVTERIVISKK
ncbi:MAG: hypothetical protein ACJA1C_000157 [Crocinitomicaceae bacterium]|jgi:hypothetical protein